MRFIEGRYFGVFPILATPFTETGALDEQSLRNLIQFQLAAGVHGLGLFGNASEGYALLEHERTQILDIVKTETKGKLPLVIGTGHTSLEGAVHYSKKAEKDGAHVLMVMAPHMIKPDATRLFEYYAGVASAVDIPIMIQDAPIASGVNLPASIIARLVREFENIIYIKVEAPPTIIKIDEVLDATHGEITVFGGLNGIYMYEEFQHGSVGTMPACEFPELAVKIFDHFAKGDLEAARQLFVRYLPLFRMGTLPNHAMSIHKEILRRMGIIASAKVRNPNPDFDERLSADLELLMEELMIEE